MSKNKRSRENIARKHHFVAVCHLAGFTPSGEREGFLQVIDMQQVKLFRSGPDEVGHIRDFDRIKVEGLEANAVENALGLIETQAAPIIKRLIASATLPSGEEFAQLMHFVAAAHCRVPRERETTADIAKFMAKQALLTVLCWTRRRYSSLDSATPNSTP